MNERGNIVMPVEAFDALEAILNSPDGDADRSLSAFGFRWGERLVGMLEEHCDYNELDRHVKQIAWEAGISKLELKLEDTEMHISVKESGIKNNNFLGGFLSGVISELLSSADEKKQFGFELEADEPVLKFSIKEATYSGPQKLIDKSPTRHPEIEFGEKYMIIEDDATDPKLSLDMLKDLVCHGNSGLCLTTIIPTKLKSKYDVHGVNFVWLTDYRTGAQEFKEMDPKRLEFEISRDARNFLSQENSVMLLHGTEYLIRHNGFQKMVDFLDTVGRIVSAKNNVLLCPIYPKALREIDYSNLRTIFKVIGD